MNVLIDIAKENYQRTKAPIPFEDMYSMLENNKSLADIGIKYHLTRERIRQIYNQHFKRLFNHKTGRQRQKETTVKVLRSKLFKINPNMLELYSRCKDYGLAFQPILTKNRLSYKKYRVIINGHFCMLSDSNEASAFANGTAPSYSRVACAKKALEDTDFVIAWQNQNKRFFVYPSLLLLTKYKADRPIIPIYLPITSATATGAGKIPHIKHEYFIENWEQLRK